MSEKDNGGPAFPREDYQTSDAPGQSGMSLRDWFAGQAIGSVIRQCAQDLSMQSAATVPEEYFAEKAYAIADAMLSERNK